MAPRQAKLPQDFERGYAEVNGQRIHVAQAGADRGRPVFFVHGFPEFWFAWRRQLAELP